MGTMHHHTIVVTSWQDSGLEVAHDKAKEIFPWVSPISPRVTNGYRSFFVPPDGSKEWWDESDAGDKRREVFFDFLSEEHKKGRYVNAVEVGFGELGTSAVNRVREECT